MILYASVLASALAASDWADRSGGASPLSPETSTRATSENVAPPLALSWSRANWNGASNVIQESSPAIVGGLCYFGSADDPNGAAGDHRLFARDASDGSFVWSFAVGDRIYASPAVRGGVVYAGSMDSRLYAWNAISGALVWSFVTGAGIWSSPAVVSSSAGDRVLVGSTDQNLYALDAASGALAWTLATGGWIKSSPSVSGGVVFCGSDDGRLYAANLATGALVWSYATGNAVYSSPAAAGGRVFAGSYDGRLYAWNAATGALAWSFLGGTSGIYSSPAVAAGRVFFGSNGYRVFACDEASGSLAWSFVTNGWVGSSPAIAGSTLYVGDNSNRLYGLDASSGSLLWSFVLPLSAFTEGFDLASPAVSGGRLFATSDGANGIFAFAPLVPLPTATPAGREGRRVFPNPFAPFAGRSLRVEGVRPGTSPTVWNLAGELVARLEAAGRDSVATWDGHIARGRAAPGLYEIVVLTPDGGADALPLAIVQEASP